MAVWRWGDWRNWDKYHAVMLYIALGNTVYHFICTNYWLWHFVPDAPLNHTYTELLYTMVIFPSSALIFLSRYPEGQRLPLLYISKWIVGYILVECLYVATQRIDYHHGWSIWWSLAFDCVMFPMLRLFQVKPLYAYPISVGIAIVWIILFQVPISTPFEERLK